MGEESFKAIPVMSSCFQPCWCSRHHFSGVSLCVYGCLCKNLKTAGQLMQEYVFSRALEMIITATEYIMSYSPFVTGQNLG